ncbi:MAG: hypothetical protein WAK91_14490, partial [Candidatus Acidiferrales bacterium]
MGILETFSKRKKRLESAGKQDVYHYDELPQSFRIQVSHIWRSALGVFYEQAGYTATLDTPVNNCWRLIHDSVAREHGVYFLGDAQSKIDSRCHQYLLNAETLSALDIIEF